MIIEEKSESGNWKGRLVKKTVAMAGGKTVEYSKTGFFPYRFVEEIEEPEELHTLTRSLKETAVSPSTPVAAEAKGEWNVSSFSFSFSFSFFFSFFLSHTPLLPLI